MLEPQTQVLLTGPLRGRQTLLGAYCKAPVVGGSLRPLFLPQSLSSILHLLHQPPLFLVSTW